MSQSLTTEAASLRATTILKRRCSARLCLKKDAYTVVCDILKPESFYDPSNQKIYAAIQSLGAAQREHRHAHRHRKAASDGRTGGCRRSAAHLELTSRVASGAHVEFHARIVAQKYLARELIKFASQIEAQAFDESYDVDDLLQEAEGKLFEISQRNVKKDVTQIDPVINSAIEQIQTAANRASGLSGLETGYHELDKLTSRLAAKRPYHHCGPSCDGQDRIRALDGQEHGCQL